MKLSLSLSQSVLMMITCYACSPSANSNTNWLDSPNIIGSTFDASIALESNDASRANEVDRDRSSSPSCTTQTDCAESEVCLCGTCEMPCQDVQDCTVDPGDMMGLQVDCVDSVSIHEVESCSDNADDLTTSICVLLCQRSRQCPRELTCQEGQCKRPRSE